MNILKISIVILLVFQEQPAKAQCGIFKTANDFLNGQLFDADKRSDLKLHELNHKDYLEITHDDSTYRFLKNEVYGYYKEGLAYRFYQNTIYSILNPGEKILLYKITHGTGIKNSPVTETYFFSRNAGSEIMPLTLPAVLSEFSENRAFEILIELYYRYDNELAMYDAIHKQYKLNRLLDLSSNFKLN